MEREAEGRGTSDLSLAAEAGHHHDAVPRRMRPMSAADGWRCGNLSAVPFPFLQISIQWYIVH